tara:strand:- start:2198 stop:2419 length:222 start_codon:yes stop_codon:yes gene_type:complete
MKIKHQISLIEHEDQLYVQRPSSWIGGWSRHLLMKRHIPKKVMIASPQLWKKISISGREVTLTVYEDDTSNLS